MHPALCHKDRKIQSAARQAREVLVREGTITGVRTIDELADAIMPRLYYPEKLGAENQRRDVLIAALYSLREARLISVHRKTAQARTTTKGKHADSLMPKQRSRAGRRGGRYTAEHAPA